MKEQIEGANFGIHNEEARRLGESAQGKSTHKMNDRTARTKMIGFMTACVCLSAVAIVALLKDQEVSIFFEAVKALGFAFILGTVWQRRDQLTGGK